MQVRFYSQTKRRNSTKLPTGGGALYTCTLKDATTVSRPSIAIKWDGASTAPANFNYCYILDFGRYYWINDWAYVDRQWIANCSVDVLTTYKRDIALSSKYVLRSASEYDADVIDTLYPSKASFKTASTVINPPYGTGMSNGVYIVSISGGGSSGVKFLQLTEAQLSALIAYCYQETASIWQQTMTHSDFGDAMQAYGEAMQKSVYNPFQYINSVMWFPAAFSADPGGSVELGPMQTNVSCSIPNNATKDIHFQLNVPSIPYTYKWEAVAPYREYILYVPPFGYITLDATLMRDISAVDVDVVFDYISGGGIAKIYGTATRAGNSYFVPLTSVSGQIGIPVAAASNSVDNLGAMTAKANAASGVIGGIANILSGNIGGAVSSANSAVASVAAGYAASAPRVQQTGVSGGIMYLGQNAILHVIQYERPETHNDEFGQPLYKVKQISTLSGYVKCADGEIESTATEEEHRELEAFLTGGFFYE